MSTLGTNGRHVRDEWGPSLASDESHHFWRQAHCWSKVQNCGTFRYKTTTQFAYLYKHRLVCSYPLVTQTPTRSGLQGKNPVSLCFMFWSEELICRKEETDCFCSQEAALLWKETLTSTGSTRNLCACACHNFVFLTLRVHHVCVLDLKEEETLLTIMQAVSLKQTWPAFARCVWLRFSNLRFRERNMVQLECLWAFLTLIRDLKDQIVHAMGFFHKNRITNYRTLNWLFKLVSRIRDTLFQISADLPPRKLLLALHVIASHEILSSYVHASAKSGLRRKRIENRNKQDNAHIFTSMSMETWNSGGIFHFCQRQDALDNESAGADVTSWTQKRQRDFVEHRNDNMVLFSKLVSAIVLNQDYCWFAGLCNRTVGDSFSRVAPNQRDRCSISAKLLFFRSRKSGPLQYVCWN